LCQHDLPPANESLLPSAGRRDGRTLTSALSLPLIATEDRPFTIPDLWVFTIPIRALRWFGARTAEPIDGCTPARRQRCPKAIDVY